MNSGSHEFRKELERGSVVALETLAPSDVAQYLETDDRILLPFGSTENNGPHLPLASDTISTNAITEEASRRTGVMVAPSLPIGNSIVNMGFAGTIAVRPAVLAELLTDICESLASHGFRRFVIVSGHYGNVWPVASVAETLQRMGVIVGQVDVWRSVEKECKDIAVTKKMPFGHGGEMMTAVLLAAATDLVHLERAVIELPPDSWGLDYYRSYPEAMGFAPWHEVSKSGSVGDPTSATAEVGRTIIARVASRICTMLADIRHAPIPWTE